MIYSCLLSLLSVRDVFSVCKVMTRIGVSVRDRVWDTVKDRVRNLGL